MRCADHGLRNCGEPKCYVLAVCAAELPYVGHRPTMDQRDRYDDWCRARQYDPTCYRLGWVGSVGAMARAISDRLVTWMRWLGRCIACGSDIAMTEWCDQPCGKCTNDECIHGCENASPTWVGYPGWRRLAEHPLDDLSSHAERVKALAGVCPKCEQPEGCHSNWCGHPVYDGVNWTTVAVYLDWLGTRGWSLDEIHDWREPDMQKKSKCPGCLEPIDPDVCHCGDYERDHVPYGGCSSFVPMGCRC